MGYVRDIRADTIIPYDGDRNWLDAICETVETYGKIDTVFDTVSSIDETDRRYNYDAIIFSKKSSLLSTDSIYISLGGTSHDWVKAHILRYFRVNLFPKGKLLFWVRLSDVVSELKELCDLIKNNQLHIRMETVYSFTEENVNEAFAKQLSRRVVGKIAIEISP